MFDTYIVIYNIQYIRMDVPSHIRAFARRTCVKQEWIHNINGSGGFKDPTHGHTCKTPSVRFR